MPIQIKRLLPLFAIFIIGFLILRSVLMPDTFGQYGFYRGDALIDNASHPLKYAGQDACVDCHSDVYDIKAADAHGEIACEACHGPGAGHIEDFETAEIIIPQGREFCGHCHARHSARSTNIIFQINLDEHNVEHDCIYCHNPHSPWDLRNQETEEDPL